MTEAQAFADLDLPPLRESLAPLTAELADPEVLAPGRRDARGRLVAAVQARVSGTDARIALISRLIVAPDRQGLGWAVACWPRWKRRLPGSVTEFRLFTGEHSGRDLRACARVCGNLDTGRQPASAGCALVHLRKPKEHDRS